MAYSPVTSLAQSLGANGGTTAGFNAAGADLILAWVTQYQVAANTPTDSNGGTYVPLTGYASSGPVQVHGQWFYLQGASVGVNGQTVAVAGSGIYASVSIFAFSGSLTSPFDKENGAGTGGGLSTLQPGSVTPAVDNSLVVVGLSHENNFSGAISINGGFSTPIAAAYSGGVSEGTAAAYLIQTTAAAANPQWDATNAPSDMCAGSAVFAPGAGGGGATVKQLAALGVG